jgi:hypothetical protein
MKVREAKDFLAQQTSEQAKLDSVSLSVENRMMYFTETGQCPEDPIGLNDAFEKQHDTKTYEREDFSPDGQGLPEDQTREPRTRTLMDEGVPHPEQR